MPPSTLAGLARACRRLAEHPAACTAARDAANALLRGAVTWKSFVRCIAAIAPSLPPAVFSGLRRLAPEAVPDAPPVPTRVPALHIPVVTPAALVAAPVEMCVETDGDGDAEHASKRRRLAPVPPSPPPGVPSPPAPGVPSPTRADDDHTNDPVR